LTARVWPALRALPRVETAILILAAILLVALRVARQGEHGPALDSYSTYDASAGGYRALYELLQREGVRVERFGGHPSSLDSALDTLVYAEPLPFDPARGEATRADAAALEGWVRAGGNLLYVGHDDAAAKAGVLHLPASRRRARRRHHPYVAPDLRLAGVATAGPLTELRWTVPKRARVLLDDGAGPLVVRYALGRGVVVAVLDERAFENAQIAAFDRARLALALAAPRRPGGALAFDEAVHGYATPSHWWSVVPKPFVVALALATVALLVAFAGAAMRLGPPVSPRPRDDRSTADFIEGLASLLERGGAVRSALADATTSTSHALARAFGLPDNATSAEIAERIESDGARARYRELVAAATNASPSEANLVRGVALAQGLRKEIVAHGRR
jgi:hypothetical protein